MSVTLNKEIKVDAAIWPAAVSSNGSTSLYFDMRDYSQALFVWTVILHSAGCTTTSTGTVYQAKNGSALTSAAGLASSTAILTASAKYSQLTITVQTAVAESDSFDITTYDRYGTALTALTYTLTACGTTATATITRGIIMGTAGGTASFSTTMTYMATAINGSTGSVGLFATATTTTITLRGLNGGDTVFLFTASNTTNFTITNAYVMGMIEVHAGKLTSSSGFTHLALNVVNESAYYTSAVCIRGGTKRKTNYNQVAIDTELI